MKTITLFGLGLGSISLQVVLHFTMRLAGYSNDVADFFLGVLLGVGLGLLFLVMNRMRGATS